jgi:anti-anti-sigma regulatory factor
MSTLATVQAHIAYELIDDNNPKVVVIEFLSQDIFSPGHAIELGEQLDSLIRPDLPRNFVIDFANVRSLGSTAFGAIVKFIRQVGRVCVCNLDESLRLGATLVGLEDWVEFADSRHAAIRAAKRGEEDTVDYPDFVS